MGKFSRWQIDDIFSQKMGSDTLRKKSAMEEIH